MQEIQKMVWTSFMTPVLHLINFAKFYGHEWQRKLQEKTSDESYLGQIPRIRRNPGILFEYRKILKILAKYVNKKKIMKFIYRMNFRIFYFLPETLEITLLVIFVKIGDFQI